MVVRQLLLELKIRTTVLFLIKYIPTMKIFIVHLPLGSAFIVTASEASEQTIGVVPVMHDMTAILYGRPGERFDTVHSDA